MFKFVTGMFALISCLQVLKNDIYLLIYDTKLTPILLFEWISN